MKKINIRTVKQQKFEIEIDENETVATLKQIIQERQNIDASTQVLIFSGKFMEDPKPIKEYNINEKDFVVLSVKAVANRPVRTTPPTTNVNTTPPVTNNPPTTNNPPNSNTNQPTSTNPTTTNPPTTTTGSNRPEEELLMGSSYEEKVKEICDMGFPREEVVRALKLSFNNTSRAVEYLTSGFPDVEEEPTPQTTGGTTGGTSTGGSIGGNIGGTTGGQIPIPQGGNVFAMLRNHPLFIQMRALVQSNPQYLEQLLNNISENSPELFQIIQQNQDQFVQFLNEPVSQEQLQQALASTLGINPGSGNAGGLSTGTGSGPGTGMGPGTGTGTVPGQNPGARVPPGQRQIQVQLTPQEIESVNNLVNMGFERNRVLHYFILFDKDQEMTANYLFDHPTEEGDQ